MKVKIPPGKYVLAVSGGIDSMVLLDIFAKQSKKLSVEVVVAHFNHGIRPESANDEMLVREQAQKHGFLLESETAKLGKNTSENKAREARYKFLYKIRQKHEADIIVTAHHQDDLIETAFINIIRGTGPKGLYAISMNKNILRPLLKVPKSEIKIYADKNNIKWLEDSTNEDERYLRNYIRRNFMPRLSSEERLRIIKDTDKIIISSYAVSKLTNEISDYVMDSGKISRARFAALPLLVANELVMLWLKDVGFNNFDRKTIERIVLSIKTAKPQTKHPINKKLYLTVESKTAKIGVL
jgi:tRNA(Ile)-lysidine synthase